MNEGLEDEMYAEMHRQLLNPPKPDVCRRVFTYAHMNGVSTVACTQYDGQDSPMINGVCSICGDPHE